MKKYYCTSTFFVGSLKDIHIYIYIYIFVTQTVATCHRIDQDFFIWTIIHIIIRFEINYV